MPLHQLHTLVSSPSGGQPMALDVTLRADTTPKPLVLLLHGFKAFKDFGALPLAAEQLAQAGAVVAKFTFSHAGTTPALPQQFGDLASFQANTLSKELADTQAVLDFLLGHKLVPAEELNGEVFLLGYSRGGTVALLTALDDPRVNKLAVLAPPTDPETVWSPEFMADWKEKGVQYVTYRWTGQQLPVGYGFAQDFLDHAQQYRLKDRLASLKQPLLAFHGTADETVPVTQAEHLKKAPSGTVHILEGADHRFGMTHPWPQPQLPEPLGHIVGKIRTFFLEN